MRRFRWAVAAALGMLTAATAIAVLLPHDSSPKPRPLPARTAAAELLDIDALRVSAALQALTLDEKLGQLMLVHCSGTDPAPVAACAAAAHASGVILMGDNIGTNPAAVSALTAAVTAGEAPVPDLVAIDEEGGSVARLPWDSLPGGRALSAASPAEVSRVFRARAELLRAVGVNVNFGIVADMTADPTSFLSDRVFGDDPTRVSALVAAAVSGEHGRVASTLKHFPGHGAAVGNSHTELPSAPLNLDAWRTSVAPPFRAGIAAGAELVMMAHVVYPAVDSAPASLSAVWHRELREELGFRGVIVSDDLLMLQRNGRAEFSQPGVNALRALQAGTDLLLWVLPSDPSTVGVNLATIRAELAAAVRSGALPESRVDDAVSRVLRLRFALARQSVALRSR